MQFSPSSERNLHGFEANIATGETKRTTTSAIAMAQADDEPLKIDMQVPNAVRVMFILLGVFIMGIVLWELGPGVWPPNIFSLFFLFMIVGAMTVGKPTVLAGLFGYSDLWTIEPGRITIDRRNWFKSEKFVFVPADIDRFDVIEVEAMEGDNTWKVVLWAQGWKMFETYDLQSRAGAEKMRDEILARMAR
jgi:hypothetical protein